MKWRFSDEHQPEGTRAILREGATAPTKTEVCRKHGISEWTFYRWQRQYQGTKLDRLRRLKQLEQENARLKKLVAEQALANEALKQVLAKKGLR